VIVIVAFRANLAGWHTADENLARCSAIADLLSHAKASGGCLEAARFGPETKARSRDRVTADDLAGLIEQVERLRWNVDVDLQSRKQ
jgi:hypothetical protein